MVNEFFESKTKPGEIFEGARDPSGQVKRGRTFETEEQFIGAGGLKTQNRQEGDPFFSNVSQITAEQLLPQAPIDISDAPGLGIDQSAEVVAGVAETAKQATEAAKIATDQKVMAQEARQEAITGDITGLLTELEGEGPAQLAAEQEAGIPEFAQQQADIQGQIAIKNAEFQQLQQQEEAEVTRIEGQPLSTAFIGGRKSQVAREFRSRKNAVAAEMTLLQAQSLAVSGRQVAAQNAVNRAISLKYDTIDKKIQTQRFLLDSVQGDLTRAEQKQANALTRQLNQEEKDLTEQKNREIAVENVAIDAAANGAPQAIIDQIKALSESGDVIQATQLAQPYLEDEDDDLLSVSEAKALGVPFGTTRADAIARGIIPPSGSDTPTSTTIKLSNLVTSTQAGRIISAGIDEQLAINIINEIIAGTELEEIRESLRGLDLNPQILDIIDTVANIEKLRGNVGGGGGDAFDQF